MNSIEDAFRIVKATLPGFELVIRSDETKKGYLANLVDTSIPIRDWETGKHRFPTHASDPLEAVRACYSWAITYVVEGIYIDRREVDLIKQ